MLVDGGHGERDGRVWVTYGREIGRKGLRERPRAALYSDAVAHRGRGLRAPAEMAAVAAGGGSGLSAALVGVAQVEGEGERERAGEWQSAARVGSPIGALGRL